MTSPFWAIRGDNSELDALRRNVLAYQAAMDRRLDALEKMVKTLSDANREYAQRIRALELASVAVRLHGGGK